MNWMIWDISGYKGDDMFYLGLVVLYAVYLMLILFPDSIIRWHARMYARHYPSERDREMVDRLQVFNPISKFVFGKMSDYMATGPEHPEAFPRVIWFFRLLGLIPLIGTTVMLIYSAIIR